MGKTTIGLAFLTAAVIFSALHLLSALETLGPLASAPLDEPSTHPMEVAVADAKMRPGMPGAAITSNVRTDNPNGTATANAASINNKTRDIPGLEAPASDIDSLSCAFSRDPGHAIALLSEILENELQERPEDVRAAASVVETIKAAESAGTILPTTLAAMRSVRCSRRLCELLFDKSDIERASVELTAVSRALRKAHAEFQLALRAPHPDDDDSWTVFLVRESEDNDQATRP